MQIPIDRRTTRKNDPERGAALITVAAILALVSVFVTVGLKSIEVEQPEDRYHESKHRMEFVMDQIAAYVHNQNRVPCPAEPDEDPLTADFGIEDRNGVDGECNETFGLIPFRTLNIPSHYLRDSWGRNITYAISPVFGDTRDVANDNTIYYICRRVSWQDNLQAANTAAAAAPTMANMSKARFCCPSPATHGPGSDIVVEDENGNPYTPARSSLASAYADAYGEIFPPTDPQTNVGGNTYLDNPISDIDYTSLQNDNINTVAVVLVSHGSNGLGALDGSGAAAKFPMPPAGSAEEENADYDANLTFVDRPQVFVDGANYYDDIVIWRTQFSLYNELNNASCSRPWR